MQKPHTHLYTITLDHTLASIDGTWFLGPSYFESLYHYLLKSMSYSQNQSSNAQ